MGEAGEKRGLFREPLLHFALIGGVVFGVFLLVDDDPSTTTAAPGSAAVEAPSRVIEVTPEIVQRLEEGFRTQWRREPTDTERQRLIDGFVRDEVLYRQAIELGLSKDDTIIRRRLIQKMEFLAEETGALPPETEDAYQSWYDLNAEEMRQPERVTFTHVYFSRDARGAAAEADAIAQLQELRDEVPSPIRAGDRGDRFMLQFDYAAKTHTDVVNLFGDRFATALADIPSEQTWEGPIESSFGHHLVRIERRVPGRVPPFEEVRDEVIRRYRADMRTQANDTMIRELRDLYEVVLPTAERP